MCCLRQLEQTERESSIRNYSSKTIKSYIYELKGYFSFKKIDFENLYIKNIKNFFLHRGNKGVSAQNRNLFLNAINSYYSLICLVNS
jgi:site-specific recombinase XerD